MMSHDEHHVVVAAGIVVVLVVAAVVLVVVLRVCLRVCMSVCLCLRPIPARANYVTLRCLRCFVPVHVPLSLPPSHPLPPLSP